jgi:excisionase family DNA binding protein
MIESNGTGEEIATGPTADVVLAPITRLLLTPSEAAVALRISPRLLWSKTKLGEIPCVRIGKAVRYSTASLQKWIERATAE